MPRRTKKGASQLYNKRVETGFLNTDDESDEDATLATKFQAQLNVTQSRKNTGNVIDLTEQESQESTNKDVNEEQLKANEDPFDELIRQSNIKELARRCLEEFFPAEVNKKSSQEYFLKLFCQTYTENPTATRCPAIKLNMLIKQTPPANPQDDELCRKFNIMPCRVDLSKGNALFSIEKRIYERFRKQHPLSKSAQFILPETLKAMTLDYFSLIRRNIAVIFAQPMQLAGINCLDRNVEKLLDKLWTLLDERTPKDPDNTQGAQEKSPEPPNEMPSEHLEVSGAESLDKDVEMDEDDGKEKPPEASEMITEKLPEPTVNPRTFRPPPQRLEILRDRIKNRKKQFSAKAIAQKLLNDRLELSVEIETPLGWREITIHGQDIIRFFNIPPKTSEHILLLLNKIQSAKEAGNLTADSVQKFSEFMSSGLNKCISTLDNCTRTKYKRYYTIQEEDQRAENLIEVEQVE